MNPKNNQKSIFLLFLLLVSLLVATFLIVNQYMDSLDSVSVFTIYCDLACMHCLSVFLIGAPHNAKGSNRVQSMLTMLILIFFSCMTDIYCRLCQGLLVSEDIIRALHIACFVLNNGCSLVFYIFARAIVRARQEYGVPLASAWLFITTVSYVSHGHIFYYLNENNMLIQTTAGALGYLMYPIIVQLCALYIAFKYNIPRKQKIIFFGFNVVPLVLSIVFRAIFKADVLSVGYTMALLICYMVFFEELDRESNSLQDSFRCYFSDEIVEKLSKQENENFFVPRYYNATVMNIDVRGFTALSQHMLADNLVAIVNHEFAVMAELIESNGGVVIEFLGDGLKAVFGAPFPCEKHEEKAVYVAMMIQNEMKSINRWNEERGFPELEIGIGISTGRVLIGGFGSSIKMVFKAVGGASDDSAYVQSFSVNQSVLVSQSTLNGIGCDLSFDVCSPAGTSKRCGEVYSINAMGSPYNISIIRKNEKTARLKHPYPIEFRVFEEKQICEKIETGHVVALNEETIVIKTDADLSKVNEIDLSTSEFEFIYAKKIRTGKKSETEFIFSSKPLNFQKWVISILIYGNYHSEKKEE